MKVLIACEYSGIVRNAFIERGHDAISCDYLPTERPGPHYEGNVIDILNNGFDLMIGHPPCTFLANSGVKHLYIEPERWKHLISGAVFFRTLLESSIQMIAIENPIPHKYALEIIGRKYNQIIQPWQFGHGETKATCLWLKNLPYLKSTNVVSGREQRIWKMSPGRERSKERSKTFEGIARAMADQWTDFVNKKVA